MNVDIIIEKRNSMVSFIGLAQLAIITFHSNIISV